MDALKVVLVCLVISLSIYFIKDVDFTWIKKLPEIVWWIGVPVILGLLLYANSRIGDKSYPDQYM